jgi:outer membrane protein assembly factor BamE (lipoprotein component of BamABCDE complex)
MFEFFQANKEDLKSWKESDLLDILGKPDEKEMYKRGQWFYVYYFEPGPSCQPTSSVKRGDVKRVEIRVSAVGNVTELILR